VAVSRVICHDPPRLGLSVAVYRVTRPEAPVCHRPVSRCRAALLQDVTSALTVATVPATSTIPNDMRVTPDPRLMVRGAASKAMAPASALRSAVACRVPKYRMIAAFPDVSRSLTKVAEKPGIACPI
jgi:hypothetical protein